MFFNPLWEIRGQFLILKWIYHWVYMICQGWDHCMGEETYTAPTAGTAKLRILFNTLSSACLSRAVRPRQWISYRLTSQVILKKKQKNSKSITRGLRITFSTLEAPKKKNRIILHFKGTFCRELVVLHTTPSMFDKFSVHAWRWSLNKEHSLLVHRGSNSFWHAKRC